MFPSALPTSSSPSSVPVFLKKAMDDLFSQVNFVNIAESSTIAIESLDLYQPKFQALQAQIQDLFSSIDDCETFLLRAKTTFFDFALACPRCPSEAIPDRTEYVFTLTMLSLVHDGLTDLVSFAALTPSLSSIVPNLGSALGTVKDLSQNFEWTFVKNTAKNWMHSTAILSSAAPEFKQLQSFFLKYSQDSFCDLIQSWDYEDGDFVLNSTLYQECLRFHCDLDEQISRSLLQTQTLQEDSFEDLSAHASQNPWSQSLTDLKNWIALHSQNGRQFSSLVVFEGRSSSRLPNRPLIRKAQALGATLAIFDPSVEQSFLQFTREFDDLVSLPPIVTASPVAHAFSQDPLLLSEFAEDLAKKVLDYDRSLLQKHGFSCAHIKNLHAEITFYQAICEQKESPAPSPSAPRALFSPCPLGKYPRSLSPKSVSASSRSSTPLRSSPLVFSKPQQAVFAAPQKDGSFLRTATAL